MNIKVSVNVGEDRYAFGDNAIEREIAIEVPDVLTATALDLRDSIHNMIALAVSEFAAKRTQDKVSAEA